jgi:hypothetical protein
MVGRVLTGNGITRYGDGLYSLIGAEELSVSERDALQQRTALAEEIALLIWDRARRQDARIERLRQAAAKKGRVVRVVDQKTAVVPLHADTLADPNKLLASVRSLVELV